jgi:hypothetical protein
MIQRNYKKILGLDESFRFAGRIKERKITAFVRREDSKNLLDDKMVILHTTRYLSR